MPLFSKILLIVFFKLILHDHVSGQMNPTYAAAVAGEWSGLMKRNFFLAQTGVGASQKINSSHWEEIRVDSFTVSVFRDTVNVFTLKNVGNIFHKNLKPLFQEIIPGDRILIFRIYATNLAGTKVFLQPLEYIIW